jgi:hypothetical protein
MGTLPGPQCVAIPFTKLMRCQDAISLFTPRNSKHYLFACIRPCRGSCGYYLQAT